MAAVPKEVKKKAAKESLGWFKRAFSQLVDDVPKDKASDIAKRFIESGKHGKPIRNKALVDAVEREAKAAREALANVADGEAKATTGAAKKEAKKKVRELEAIAFKARNLYDSARWHQQSPDIARGDPARGVWRNYISDPAYDFYALAAGPSFGASTVTRWLSTGRRIHDAEGRTYAFGLAPGVSNLFRGPVPAAVKRVKSGAASAAKWTWNQVSPWELAFSSGPGAASNAAKKPGKIGTFLTDRRTIGVPTMAGLTYLYLKNRWPGKAWGGALDLSKAAGGKVVDFADWVRGKNGDKTDGKTFERTLSELAAAGPGNLSPEQYNELLAHYNEMKGQDLRMLSDGDREAFKNNLDRVEDILVTDPRTQAAVMKEAEGLWNEEHGATSLYTFDEMIKEDPSEFIRTVADPLRERVGGSFDKKATEYYLRSLNLVADPDPVYDL